jgi:hypothetical protein
MSTKLTNQGTLEQDPEGQPVQASEQSQEAGTEKTVRESDLRALKSKLDKQIAFERNEKAALLARLNNLENQHRQAVTRGMDEDELRAYQLQEREALINQQWAFIQQQQQDNARQNLFRRISKVHGVPVEDLEEAETPDDAWEIGAQYARKQEEERTEEKVKTRVAKKQSAADVDIDSGSPPSDVDSFAALYQAGDARGYILKRLQAKQEE